MTIGRHLLFSGLPWFDSLTEASAGLWEAWRITKSEERAWWVDVLDLSADFAAEHALIETYRKRLYGICVGDMTAQRGQRDGRRGTDPIWEIVNELIVACLLQNVLGWTLVDHEPEGSQGHRADWLFRSDTGRPVFVEVKTLREPSHGENGTYSRAVETKRLHAVLRQAYRQLPEGDIPSLVVLVGSGQILRVPFGIMHGDLFQCLFGRMAVRFRAVPYDPESFAYGPTLRDMFLQPTKNRRVTAVAGLVVTGGDQPALTSYAIPNPFAHQTRRLADDSFAPLRQVVFDESEGVREVSGLGPLEVWEKMRNEQSTRLPHKPGTR